VFVILGNYIKPLEEVDRVLPAHREFLDRHFAAGTFICSGPSNPRTGGIILCTAGSREEVEAIMAQDPFTTEQVAEYTVHEFSTTKASAEFAGLIGK